MGRPIQKKWFGPSSGSGLQIIVDGVRFADGTLATPAYIVKQVGDREYIVSDGVKSEPAFLANVDDPADLLPGFCRIAATPFGGAPRSCEKIAQYRVSIYEADGTIKDYSWSTIPATKKGQADLDLG